MRKVLTVILGGAATISMTVGAVAQEQVQPPPPPPIFQDPNPNVSVLERTRPDYNPLGIRARSFLIFPSIGLLGEYDDNVRATDNDEEDDYSLSVVPRIAARSQWSRHELNVITFGDFAFFANDSDNNYQDFGIESEGLLEINSRNTLVANAGIQREHDDRDDPDEINEDDVTEFWNAEAGASYRYSFNRFFVQPGGFAQRLDYQEAGDVSNSERDRSLYGGNFRFGYTVTPRLDVFTQATYIRSVRDTSDAGGRSNDNTRYIGTVGTNIDITGVIFGEAQIGYEYIEFDDDEFDSEQNPFAEAGITWNVTQLTSLLFSGSASQEDTNVTVDGEEASSRLEQDVGIEVQHELLRNVILEANGIYERDDFQGVDRTDNTFRTGFGVTYLLNRNLSLIANYNYSNRNSDVDSAEFSRNIFRVGINARL